METDKVRLYKLMGDWHRSVYSPGAEYLDVNAVCTEACDESGNLYNVYYPIPAYTPAVLLQMWIENELDIETPSAVRRSGERTIEGGDGYMVVGSLPLSRTGVAEGGTEAVRRELVRAGYPTPLPQKEAKGINKIRLHITSSPRWPAALKAVIVPEEVCRYRRGLEVYAYTEDGEMYTLKYTTLTRAPKFADGESHNPFEVLPCNGFFPANFYDWRHPDKVIDIHSYPSEKEKEVFLPDEVCIVTPDDDGYIDFHARHARPRRARSFVKEPAPNKIVNENIIDNDCASEYEVLDRATVVLEIVRMYKEVRDPAVVAIMEQLAGNVSASLSAGDSFEEHLVNGSRRNELWKRANDTKNELSERSWELTRELTRGFTGEEYVAYLDALKDKCKPTDNYLRFLFNFRNPAVTYTEHLAAQEQEQKIPREENTASPAPDTSPEEEPSPGPPHRGAHL